MYCAWRIPAHLRCTQCSILLHLMDICFLTCICLWQISHIGGVGSVGGEWVGCLDQGRVRWSGVMSV